MELKIKERTCLINTMIYSISISNCMMMKSHISGQTSLLFAMFNVYEAKSVNPSLGRTNMEIDRSIASHSAARVVTMTDQTGNNTTPQNQPQTTEKPASPDPNVQAPQNVLITEGYEPPKRPLSDIDKLEK